MSNVGVSEWCHCVRFSSTPRALNLVLDLLHKGFCHDSKVRHPDSSITRHSHKGSELMFGPRWCAIRLPGPCSWSAMLTLVLEYILLVITPQACNPCTQEGDAGGWQVQGLPQQLNMAMHRYKKTGGDGAEWLSTPGFFFCENTFLK